MTAAHRALHSKSGVGCSRPTFIRPRQSAEACLSTMRRVLSLEKPQWLATMCRCCTATGGSGKEDGDRHPKIGDGVLISVGAKVLGNIRVGECAKIGGGSVVLTDVPAYSAAVGVPAKIIHGVSSAQPSRHGSQC